MSSPSAASWLSHATTALREAGLRRGGARLALIELLAEQPCALSAADIESALGRSGRRVSRASTYRILEELERLRLVSRLELGHETVRYEKLQADPHDHHHHLVCDDCGDIIPFKDDALERAIHRFSERAEFDVSEHELILRGHCAACQG